MKKTNSKSTDRHLYINFLKRSSECLKSADKALKDASYASASICAIHGCISAVDTLCVYYLSKRSTSSRHEDAAQLLMSVQSVKHEELSGLKTKVLKILKVKNMAEYEERLIREKEAIKLCEDAREVLGFVVSKLPAA